MLESLLRYLVIAGDDGTVPFHRVPDEASISNEAMYPLQTGAETSMRAALGDSYFLSDDPFTRLDATVAWPGRNLYLTDSSVGRLLETPAEIPTLTDAFLGAPTRTVSSGLVVRYDFLLDQAQAVREEMVQGNLTPDEWGSDRQQADDLKAQ